MSLEGRVSAFFRGCYIKSGEGEDAASFWGGVRGRGR